LSGSRCTDGAEVSGEHEGARQGALLRRDDRVQSELWTRRMAAGNAGESHESRARDGGDGGAHFEDRARRGRRKKLALIADTGGNAASRFARRVAVEADARDDHHNYCCADASERQPEDGRESEAAGDRSRDCGTAGDEEVVKGGECAEGGSAFGFGNASD